MTLIHLKRIDPARNMARFYEMALQPTFFGQFTLLREWGRIGQAGRLRANLFEDEQAAAAMLFTNCRMAAIK